jgi:hypothetical protein
MAGSRFRSQAWAIAIRLVVGVVAGVFLGAAFWVVHLLWEGKSLVEAAQGRVEDAIGLLQGLTTLGGLVGLVVGFFVGLAAARSERQDK